MPLPKRSYDRTVNAEIERLLYQVSVVRQDAEGLLWGLSEDQFNWIPPSRGWSMAQCFAHLNITNQLLINNIETAIGYGRARGIVGDGPFTYGFLSRWLLRSLQPTSKRKLKAPAKFHPKPGKDMKTILSEWESTHARLSELIRQSDGLDLAKVKVVSPVTSLLKYGLGMAFWIGSTHDRRHLAQAREIRNTKGFPA